MRYLAILRKLPAALFSRIRSFKPKIFLFRLKYVIWHFTTFIFLLLVYLSAKGGGWLSKKRFFPSRLGDRLRTPLSRFSSSVYKHTRYGDNTISRVNLIELALRNMRAKPARTIITVGGMSVGIGAVVFLVSVGYGLQNLVTTRVARLEEMRQIDVHPQTGARLKITDQSLSDFESIGKVKHTLPLIAVVGRINFQNSETDVAVYGVTTEYLKQSAIKPVQGKIFESDNLVVEIDEDLSGQVAGLSVEVQESTYGDKMGNVEISINPSAWLRVRGGPGVSYPILGYTRRVEGFQTGEEYLGESYDSTLGKGRALLDENEKWLGKWVKSRVFLWEKVSCEEALVDCENGEYLLLRDTGGSQVQEDGYFAELNLVVEPSLDFSGEVLASATQSASIESSGSADLLSTESSDSTDSTSDTAEFIEIASESGITKPTDTKKVEILTSAKREAVVNRAFLKVLGLKEGSAVGKSFEASFIVVGDLLENPEEKIESIFTQYTIVGVVPDEDVPFFYVPFIDLRGLGITNYSQIKVVVANRGAVSNVRKKIEAMGYVTSSVVDTVAQIESLFKTARLILASVGLVALAVAALGMFNTMSVSLLERTREVGLMKAMGMKSNEVQELFLTESMVMGFFGGILGITLGLVVGKVLGLIISVFSVIKGVGFIDITYLPIVFVLVIIFLSFFVGLVTGFYPARRATKISTLNALRYE